MAMSDDWNEMDEITGSHDFRKLQRIISDIINVDRELINYDSHLEHDLGGDSLDVVEVVIMIEVEFDLEIDDEAASCIKTVKDAFQYIQRQKKV